jgi:hypothetical protein
MMDHKSQYGYFEANLAEGGEIVNTIVSTTGLSTWARHGMFMYLSWGFGGLIMIITNRYMKHYHRIHMWIHFLVGNAITFISMHQTFWAIRIE